MSGRSESTRARWMAGELTDDEAAILLKKCLAAPPQQDAPEFIRAVTKQASRNATHAVVWHLNPDQMELRDLQAGSVAEIPVCATHDLDEHGAPAVRELTMFRANDGSFGLKLPQGLVPDGLQVHRLLVGQLHLVDTGTQQKQFKCRRLPKVASGPGDRARQTPTASQLSARVAAHASTGALSIEAEPEHSPTRLKIALTLDSVREGVFVRATVSWKDSADQVKSASGLVELRPSGDSGMHEGAVDIARFAESLDGRLTVKVEPMQKHDLHLLAGSKLVPQNQTSFFLGARGEQILSIPIDVNDSELVLHPNWLVTVEEVEAAIANPDNDFCLQLAPVEGRSVND